jgi:hypothetical protein
VKQSLFAEAPVDAETSHIREDILAIGQFWSTVLRLQVFYALMYVVVEGYLELEVRTRRLIHCLRSPISSRPSGDSAMPLSIFKRFPFQQSSWNFLDAEGSEKWTYDLSAALKSFFEKQLPIKEYLASLPKRDTQERAS